MTESTVPAAARADADGETPRLALVVAYALTLAAYGWMLTEFGSGILRTWPALEFAVVVAVAVGIVTHAAAWRAGAGVRALLLALGLGGLAGALAWWRVTMETGLPQGALATGLSLARWIAFFAAAGLTFLAPLARLANGAGAPVADGGGYPAELCRIWLTQLVAAFIAGLGMGLAFLIAALFDLVGFDLLLRLLRRDEVWSALAGGLFGAALAMLVTAPARMRGVANLFFLLTGWLAVPATLAAVAFVAMLPFTGLAPLWATRSAASILLGIAFTLFCVLGAVLARPTGGRFGAVMLALVRAGGPASLVLSGLAVWAILLRVGQHGLSPDRVLALVVGLGFGAFALAYTLALLLPAARIRLMLARMTAAAAIIAALAAVAVALPPFDAARLSAASQAERLRAGTSTLAAATAGHFAIDLGRYGRLAIDELRAAPGKLDFADFAAAVAKADETTEPAWRGRPELSVFVAGFERHVVVAPAGAVPPGDLVEWIHHNFLGDMCREAAEPARRTCLALKVDLRRDGRETWLLAARQPRDGSGRAGLRQVRVVERGAAGGWYGHYVSSSLSVRDISDAQWDALAHGGARIVEPEWRELRIDDRVIVPIGP